MKSSRVHPLPIRLGHHARDLAEQTLGASANWRICDAHGSSSPRADVAASRRDPRRADGPGNASHELERRRVAVSGRSRMSYGRLAEKLDAAHENRRPPENRSSGSSWAMWRTPTNRGMLSGIVRAAPPHPPRLKIHPPNDTAHDVSVLVGEPEASTPSHAKCCRA